MINIVIVFPNISDGQKIKNLLVRNGFEVAGVCSSGAQAMSITDELDYGVVVCGYKFNDMIYSELYAELEDGFQMLLVASPGKLSDGVEDGVVAVDMPLKANDMIETLDEMVQALEKVRKQDRKKPRQRNIAKQAIIDKAKEVLMKNRNMSEEEAHRYIEKTAMDECVKKIEVAEKIIERYKYD